MPWSRRLWVLSLLALTTAGQCAELSERQIRLLVNNCLQCHARAHIGAPVMGDPADWAVRNKQGEATLLRNVVQGLRGMPPAGYCSACDEADLRLLTRQVAGLEPAP